MQQIVFAQFRIRSRGPFSSMDAYGISQLEHIWICDFYRVIADEGAAQVNYHA